MDDPTKFINGREVTGQQDLEPAWNETEDIPPSYFAPMSNDFETGSEPQSEAEGGAGEKVADLKDKASQATEAVQEKAHDLTDQAHAMSDKGLESAAAGLGQAASMLRQQGDAREGTLGTAATKTADTLEQASTYLQDTDTDQFVADLEEMVRKRPVESVLVAVGVGYLLSKIMS